MTDLAVTGGTPVRSTPYPGGPFIDRCEREAVERVLASGVLSGFIGTPGAHHLGGPEVRALEAQWARMGGYREVVSVNSATAALHVGVAAMELEPGSEVIVPPFTMSATVAAVVMCGLVPRFADIDLDAFTLTSETVEPRLTDRTRGILAVHLFGQMAPMAELRALAEDKGLRLLEDAAQAPGAMQDGKWPGHDTTGAVFSLNQHKTITSGEGGLLATNDARVADIARLLRNHAESVVHAFPEIDPVNLWGLNYRSTEVDAAIAGCQTDKLEGLTEHRLKLAESLRRRIDEIPGLAAPVIRPGNHHVYFMFALRFDESVWRCSREALVDALVAEGVPAAAGYVLPLYTLPAFGDADRSDRDPALFPNCERLAKKELILLPVCRWPATDADIESVADAIEKCWAGRSALREAAQVP